jgi:hypothetical protein
MDRTLSEGQFEGMPEPYRYWLVRQAGEVLVGFGRRVMFRFDERDMGMRNLAVVALTEAGAKGTEARGPTRPRPGCSRRQAERCTPRQCRYDRRPPGHATSTRQLSTARRWACSNADRASWKLSGSQKSGQRSHRPRRGRSPGRLPRRYSVHSAHGTAGSTARRLRPRRRAPSGNSTTPGPHCHGMDSCSQGPPPARAAAPGASTNRYRSFLLRC